MSTTTQNSIQSTLKTFYDANWKFEDFLTEDDVRCRLFESLHKSLKDYQDVSVHSEIRWYGENHKLKYRSDIVIIDNNGLRTCHSDVASQNEIFLIDSKGYCFKEYYTIIEIKLRRPNNKNSDLMYEETYIKKDISKLREIKETIGGLEMNKKYFVLVFDKKNRRKSLIDIDNSQNIDWDNWESQ